MPGNAESDASERTGLDETVVAVSVVVVVIVVVGVEVATRAALAGRNTKADEFSLRLTPPDGGVSTSTDGVQGSVRGEGGM